MSLMSYICWEAGNGCEEDGQVVDHRSVKYAVEEFASIYRDTNSGDCPDDFVVMARAPDGHLYDFPVHVSYVPQINVGAPGCTRFNQDAH